MRIKPIPKHRRRGVRHNIRPAVFILIIPFIVGLGVVVFFMTGFYGQALGKAGNERLLTDNWEAADKAFADRLPAYEQKFAYYKLKDGQTLSSVAAYFSMSEQELTTLNPGAVVAGTTIKVPPLKRPLTPGQGANGKIFGAQITDDQGFIRVKQPHKSELAITTIPELLQLLQPYGVIEATGPLTYRLNKGISLEGNIRLEMTGQTVKKLELRSVPQQATCLCLDEASALLQDTEVISFDPATGKPDTTHANERSFVRAKNARLDAINVKFSYLGNDLPEEGVIRANPTEKEGGTYGVSWRISDGRYGSEVTTGWVENSSFNNNHFGAYTFGASGMIWRNNLFAHNDVYGLDPHDDSNNALIENNVFEYNGKHGFIVSKRCNYNIIRNNTSVGNKLHGFMLHQDSVYNLVENNVAFDNTDNFVIYDSDYNTLQNNFSYNARSSHVRINQNARNNFVINNQLIGGRRGVFIYGNSGNVYIAKNTIHVRKEVLTTESAQNILFANNNLDKLSYKIGANDRLIFGLNQITSEVMAPPASAAMPRGYTTKR